MKSIFATFAIFFCVVLQAADLNPSSLARIKALEAENKELRAEIKERDADIRAMRRSGTLRANSNLAEIQRGDRSKLEKNEVEIAAIRSGKTNIAEPKKPSFYAPPPIIVPYTAAEKAAMATNAAKTNLTKPAAKP